MPAVRVLSAAGLAAGLVLALVASPAQSQVEPREGRSLPRFQGTLIGGGRVDTDVFAGRRGLIYLFSSSDPDGERIAGVVGRIFAAAEKANVVFLGVSRDSSPERARIFAGEHGLDIPILDDRSIYWSAGTA